MARNASPSTLNSWVPLDSTYLLDLASAEVDPPSLEWKGVVRRAWEGLVGRRVHTLDVKQFAWERRNRNQGPLLQPIFRRLVHGSIANTKHFYGAPLFNIPHVNPDLRHPGRPRISVLLRFVSQHNLQLHIQPPNHSRPQPHLPFLLQALCPAPLLLVWYFPGSFT